MIIMILLFKFEGNWYEDTRHLFLTEDDIFL